MTRASGTTNMTIIKKKTRYVFKVKHLRDGQKPLIEGQTIQ